MSTQARAAWVAVGAALLLCTGALGVLLVTVQGPTPPPVDDYAVTVPAVCAPAGDTYAGDGDPAGTPCDGG